MVRHLVIIVVPATADYDELKASVEVYSRGNHYPFNNAPVFSCALNELAKQYDDEEYRQHIGTNSAVSGGGTQDVRMDEMVAGNVKEEE